MTSENFYLIFAITVLILALVAINVPVASAQGDATPLPSQSQQDNSAATSQTTRPSRDTATQPTDAQTDSISALQDSLKLHRLESTAWQAQIPWLLVAVIVFVAVLYWLTIAMTNTTKAQAKLLYVPYIALVFLIALGIYSFVLLPALKTAETKKAANLVAEKREVEDQGKAAGTVVSQSPEADT